MEQFLTAEEAHVDEVEAELANLDQIGESLWLAKWC
jgi:bacterioferritin (cytochrome b1)